MNISSYKIYNKKVKTKTKVSVLNNLFPSLPNEKFDVLYVDPPWHYNGKLQFDRSGQSKVNNGWSKNVFVSAASFKYPTIKTSELKKLNVKSITEDDCLLFMWTSNPHLKQAVELGTSWGFCYKTVVFVWNKMVHNPGQYTMSYCELCLLFKKGRIPKPRGARNIKQLVNVPRGKHSKKPTQVIENIEKMFPESNKIELFSRQVRDGWSAWGLETIYNNAVVNKEDVLNEDQNDLTES